MHLHEEIYSGDHINRTHVMTYVNKVTQRKRKDKMKNEKR